MGLHGSIGRKGIIRFILSLVNHRPHGAALFHQECKTQYEKEKKRKEEKGKQQGVGGLLTEVRCFSFPPTAQR
jgi:hypothetical protein